jgi:AraC-like DNA-binding protein
LKLNQNEIKKSLSFLNQNVNYIKGRETSFYVHYWGGEESLQTNHLHKHSFFEVCHILDGNGCYIDDKQRYPLHKGVLFLSRPHVNHQITTKSGLSIIFLAFELIENESSKEAILRFRKMKETNHFYSTEANPSAIMLLWNALLFQAQNNKILIENTVHSLSLSLIISLETFFNESKKIYQNHQIEPIHTTLIHQAKLYIRDNLSQPLRLCDVANHIHISPRHLSRLFSDELGQTYSNYVRKERIRQALSLFSTTNWTIKKIAEETGFDSVQYFTSVFKAEMEVSPGQFRDKLKNNPELFPVYSSRP